MPKMEQGVHRRVGSTRWQLRVKAPTDLCHLFPPHGDAWRGSLGTSDSATANARALAKRAECAGLFASMRGRGEGGPVGGPIRAPVAGLEAPVKRSSTALGLTLRHVFDRWKAAGGRGRDAVRQCERALEMFEEWAQRRVPLESITRAMGHEFKGWLLRKVDDGQMASKTASDRMTALRGLLRFAWEELEVISRHPWKGKALDIAFVTETPRSPHLPEHMRALSALPLFKAYALPSDWKAGKDAAYWLPLIALYSGATVSELVQMGVDDVRQHGADDYRLRFTGKGEGKGKLKTEARERTVPMHSELVRLGLVDYWQRVRDAGHVRLWPAVPLNPAKRSIYFSNWWGTFRKPGGIELLPDFHTFRHTARTALGGAAGATDKVKDTITGHTTTGSAGATVYTHAMSADMQRAVEAMRFEGLELCRAFPPEGWSVPGEYQPRKGARVHHGEGGS